jgi:hypothetical protein
MMLSVGVAFGTEADDGNDDVGPCCNAAASIPLAPAPDEPGVGVVFGVDNALIDMVLPADVLLPLSNVEEQVEEEELVAVALV